MTLVLVRAGNVSGQVTNHSEIFFNKQKDQVGIAWTSRKTGMKHK